MIFRVLSISAFLAVAALPSFASASTNLKGGSDPDRELNKSIFNNDFFYPKDMPSPPEMWIEGFASRLHAQNIQKYETPMQVWQTWRLDQIMWNCIVAYHPTALDALTKERPAFVIPSEYHTSEARALCMIYAVNKLVPELIPISAVTISSWLDELGLESAILSSTEARNLVLEGGSVAPRVVGSYLASEVINDMHQDGWNYKGLIDSDGNMCTANCRPFSDTTGYAPKNDPWSIKDPKKWQPLIESDDLGFFYAQEHVTPHIGKEAKPVILTRDEVDARELADPGYNLKDEADSAIENVALLDNSSDGLYRKTMIKFMDNKINIAGGMIMRLREKYNLSLEAQVFYHYGYTSTELDVVILAWKEKVRHDLIRPTSVVQARGDAMVASFAGEHKAKDWVPFIRVMPHAEYPSGSGCICLGIAQYIDAFLEDAYDNTDSIETTWSFDEIGDIVFKDMTELYETCGNSRIWGGMHFNASVPDSYKLCDDVGTKGYYDLMKPLLGDGDYNELMDDTKIKFGN